MILERADAVGTLRDASCFHFRHSVTSDVAFVHITESMESKSMGSDSIDRQPPKGADRRSRHEPDRLTGVRSMESDPIDYLVISGSTG